jgi:predicted membrane metal-binding protein
MVTGLCFFAGFVGGLVAWQILTVLDVLYLSNPKHRVPNRVPESSTRSASAENTNWKGVNLDTWA